MNKRHYEHTLPNIRGSLSNTYIVGMKWNIYTSTIYYKRLQVTFTATLSRPGSDTKKVLKGKFMQRYPYDCSEIHHEVKDSLED